MGQVVHGQSSPDARVQAVAIQIICLLLFAWVSSCLCGCVIACCLCSCRVGAQALHGDLAQKMREQVGCGVIWCCSPHRSLPAHIQDCPLLPSGRSSIQRQPCNW
jgi:hypothetical protein